MSDLIQQLRLQCLDLAIRNGSAIYPAEVVERATAYEQFVIGEVAKPDYQQRVIKEKEDLDEKAGKLLAYSNSPAFQLLNVVDKTLLEQQHVLMGQYSAVLAKRIAAFRPPVNP